MFPPVLHPPLGGRKNYSAHPGIKPVPKFLLGTYQTLIYSQLGGCYTLNWTDAISKYSVKLLFSLEFQHMLYCPPNNLSYLNQNYEMVAR